MSVCSRLVQPNFIKSTRRGNQINAPTHVAFSAEISSVWLVQVVGSNFASCAHRERRLSVRNASVRAYALKTAVPLPIPFQAAPERPQSQGRCASLQA